MMDLLAEYSIPGTAIGHGSRPTSIRFTSGEPGSGGHVSDDQIRTALQGWIATGTASAPTANTLYFIYLPPNVKCTGPGSTGTSCAQFCGYHDAIGSSLFYAVVPYVNCKGCKFPGDILDTLTEVSSHELCEAITDPALGTWFEFSPPYPEIGDICNQSTTRLGKFLIQKEWSNRYGACIIPAVPAAARSPLDGYQTSFNKQQHVNFIGLDNHVHELWYDDEWHHSDLTVMTGAPSVAPWSSLDGYATTFNDQQHVNFIGTDHHVHEFCYTDDWHYNDLTALAGTPPAASGSSLDGYQTTFNKQQHVNYVTDDGHVQELYYTNAWHHNDLTLLTGAPTARIGSPLDGYQTTFNEQQHVNYLTDNGHVHELYCTNAWHHSDVTALTGAPPASVSRRALDGYETKFNEQQHVNYLTTDGHVHELYYTNAWYHNDLTALTGAPIAEPQSPLGGYQTAFNKQQHVNYLGGDGHVHELFYTNAWHHNDLTALAGAPNADPGSGLDGYATTFNEQQHVNYLTPDGHVQELFYTDAWHHNDLTIL